MALTDTHTCTSRIRHQRNVLLWHVTHTAAAAYMCLQSTGQEVAHLAVRIEEREDAFHPGMSAAAHRPGSLAPRGRRRCRHRRVSSRAARGWERAARGGERGEGGAAVIGGGAWTRWGSATGGHGRERAGLLGVAAGDTHPLCSTLRPPQPANCLRRERARGQSAGEGAPCGRRVRKAVASPLWTLRLLNSSLGPGYETVPTEIAHQVRTRCWGRTGALLAGPMDS